MEAPEKIWVQEGTGYEGNDILIAQDGSEVWHKDCATQYIRADIADELARALERLINGGCDVKAARTLARFRSLTP